METPDQSYRNAGQEMWNSLDVAVEKGDGTSKTYLFVNLVSSFLLHFSASIFDRKMFSEGIKFNYCSSYFNKITSIS